MILNKVGMVFGRLTVLEKIGVVNETSLWRCGCVCGNKIDVTNRNLVSNKTKSCGCLVKDRNLKNGESFKTHGLSKYPEYATWLRIKQRCFDKNSPAYRKYGLKGILLSKEYVEDFEVFLSEVGRKPLGKFSIDRIDNSRGYEKGNMRWACDIQQARNKGKVSYNTSGFTGVSWLVQRGHTYAMSHTRVKRNGVFSVDRKTYSVNKYGLLPAFYLACKNRETTLKITNETGVKYGDKHGK